MVFAGDRADGERRAQRRCRTLLAAKNWSPPTWVPIARSAFIFIGVARFVNGTIWSRPNPGSVDFEIRWELRKNGENWVDFFGTRKLCLQISGLRMYNFMWNRFPIKNLLIDSLLTPIVESPSPKKFQNVQKRWWIVNGTFSQWAVTGVGCCGHVRQASFRA